MNKVFHSHDGGDEANIISKEETTYCAECAHHVSLFGDGGLDTARVVCCSEGSRHDDCGVRGGVGIATSDHGGFTERTQAGMLFLLNTFRGTCNHMDTS